MSDRCTARAFDARREFGIWDGMPALIGSQVRM